MQPARSRAPRIAPGLTYSAVALLLWAATSGAAEPPAAAVAPQEKHVESPALYAQWGLDPSRLPYRKDVDARHDFEKARARAASEKKLLMVTFGANWCPDCRALHDQLHAEPVRSFVAEHYEVATVDVGDFDRNLQLAKDLGVDLQMGIPVAIFFGADGRVIGTTNRGELEPARTFTSHQILQFLQEIVEDRRIVAPAGHGPG